MPRIDWSMIFLRSMVALLALLFLVRVFPPLRLLLLFFLIVSLAGAFIYFVLQASQQQRQRRDFLNSVEGKISGRIRNCQEQVNAYEAECGKIEKHIEQLRDRLAGTKMPGDVLQAETARLIAGFEQERALRMAKIEFFQECIDKLEKLVQRHRLSEELERKKAELETLREKQYDDLASLENLRWDIEREETYLQTITDLTHQARRTDTVDQTLHLRELLQQMQTR